MILEPVRRKRIAPDDSFVGVRVGILFMLAMFLFAVLAFRLWYLQILSGDEYSGSATVNRVRTVMVEAPRGVIYDRKGRVLVDNRGGLSVGILPMYMYDPQKEAALFYAELTKLAEILKMPVADLLSAYEKAKRDPYMTYVVAQDVSENGVVAYLKEHSPEFPGVEIVKTYLREYPNKALAAHVLGYVGEISKEELEKEEFAGLKAGAHIGKDGVERQYDSYLRGTDGWKKVEVNASGQPMRFVEDVAAEPGYNLVLTLDADLQKAAEAAIVEGIERAHADGFRNAAGGAVVAMDPNTGEILALASYPDYDPSVWVGGIEPAKYQELTAPQANYPLFNRAVNGLYPAGSTFKPFVAAVALDAGVVTWDTILNCNGKYSVAGQTWKDWRTEGHGDLNLVAAIAQSCDVYFYNLGKLLYDQTSPVLQEGLRRFGFGSKTGVDLPGETNGSRVPDKTWKRLTGKTAEEQLWKPGDEINLAIGQGDLLVTPLQLAVALSALVNGQGTDGDGVVWVPRVALEITDSTGATVHPFASEKAGELGMSAELLSRVRRGMRLVTSDPSGTAYQVFRDFPIPVGGKTGTAQKAPDDDYALFIGYAPADGQSKPEIVVAAVIEEGGHGSSVAAPVVRRVLEAYFGLQRGGSEVVRPTE
ncbi:MAG: penicillin-binding protein 2 [Thermoleophilia bacterium]|nr:penicillin-binding protein 2 [Thermoleophilia bacterium]